RAPLNPTVPADAHDSVSPLVSVIVTIVLMNVALMWAIARVTPLRTRFFGAAFAPAAGFAVSAMDVLRTRIDRNYAVPARSTRFFKPRLNDRRRLRRLLPELLHALFAGDGLARPLAGTGVGAGALAADRERAAVPVAAVAADVAQPRDVLLDAAAQGALDQEALVD